MAADAPTIQTIKATEARQHWSELLNKVFRRDARVIVEKSGIPVAAIISVQELERFERLEAERAARFKALDESQAAFTDVPNEELDREINRAVSAARRARHHAATTPE